MKKALKIILGAVLIALVSCILMAVLAIILPGTTDSDGAKHFSDFSSIIMLAVPALVAFFYVKLQRTKKSTKPNKKEVSKESNKSVVLSNSEKSIEQPLTEKESREISEGLIEKATSAMERAYNCSSIVMFVYYGIEINRLLKEAEKYENNAGFEDYQKKDFQKKHCNLQWILTIGFYQ